MKKSKATVTRSGRRTAKSARLTPGTERKSPSVEISVEKSGA